MAKNGPECDKIWADMSNLLKDFNMYDLYRKVYPKDADNDSAHKHLNSEDRIATVEIGGQNKTYKRGYTMKEYTPWLARLLENHP